MPLLTAVPAGELGIQLEEEGDDDEQEAVAAGATAGDDISTPTAEAGLSTSPLPLSASPTSFSPPPAGRASRSRPTSASASGKTRAVPVLVPSTSPSALQTVAVALATDAVPRVQQKPNIKVRIITWNMHDAIPKGDLEVLLGKVGPFIAPEPGWDVAADSEVEEDTEEEEEHEQANLAPGTETADPLAAERRQLKRERRLRRGKAVVGQESLPRKDRIPPLPYDEAHPFHVLIVAGQEAPFGDGNRLATSVGLAGELSDLGLGGRSSSSSSKTQSAGPPEIKVQDHAVPATPEAAAADESKEKNNKTPSPTGAAELVPPIRTSASGTATPIPGTPGGGSRGTNALSSTLWGLGGKGWSDVCEEWYCKGPAAAAAAPVDRRGSKRKQQAREKRRNEEGYEDEGDEDEDEAASIASLLSPGLMSPAEMSRASSPVQIQVQQPSTPILETLAPALMAASPPKGRAKEGLAALSSSSSGKLAVPLPGFMTRSSSNLSLTDALLQARSLRPATPAGEPGTPTTARPRPRGDLRLTIPEQARLLPSLQQSDAACSGLPPSLGPYELVIKERMLGCYIACYVWRGCLDRVQGVSKGHVKSGLLAGRVGNKGGAAISLKLGQTRLLFVNAHLAGERVL